jgi:tetratricopeptide (TPR) repeat protein
VLLLVKPPLSDRVRAVRMSAAARLVEEADELAEGEFRGALDEAIAEYRASQEMHLDRADAHLSLATLHEQLKDVRAAIESFRAAMRVEPYRAGPRRELARLLDMVATDPAYALLREKINPTAEEIRRLRAQEVDLLARDARLLPGDPRPHYDRGLLLYLLGELDAAREALEEACRLAPDDYQAWMALALICEKQQRWDDAGRAVLRMKELQPEAEDWKGLLLRMRDTLRAQQEAEAAAAPDSESQSPEDREATAAPDAEP